jgi:hypothetical protein
MDPDPQNLLIYYYSLVWLVLLMSFLCRLSYYYCLVWLVFFMSFLCSERERLGFISSVDPDPNQCNSSKKDEEISCFVLAYSFEAVHRNQRINI